MEYDITTQSGKKYHIEKSNGLWLVKNEYPILWLGKERKIAPTGLVGRVMIQANDGNSHFIRVQEEEIDNAFMSRECVGQQMFYANPESYQQLMLLKKHMHDPSTYAKYINHLGITTKIADIS